LVRAAEALSPLKVLQRGYSLTTMGESLQTIRSYKQVQVGQKITTHLSEGIVVSRIESTNDNS
jgi:exonuclease VII large subunit